LWDFIVKLNQSGVTIILTTHYLEEAEQLCRNIGIIHQGNLIEYASMRDLLKKLHVESFILYLKSPINNDKIISSFNYTCRIIDEMTLEIDLKEHQNLSDLIQDLYAMGYVVQSMRNKVNRLEELFLRLTAL
jgi:ABC-2 type transport system ATP-binding protein